jgi:CRP/FNR family transcriptional regulator
MLEAASLIARMPLFQGLAPDQLDHVGAICVERAFGKGETIFSEGDKASGFYIVAEGQVKIYKLSMEGKEHILHIYGPGHPFGEVPVFAGENFPAHAQALVSTRLLFLPRDAFLAMITANPDLALKMMAVLSSKLRSFTVQIENLSLKEVPARLASYLLYLDQEQGNEHDLSLTISKTQLAAIIGTIPETLSRIFRRLSKQHLIAVKGRHIRLLQVDKLQEMADVGRELV